MKTSLDRWRELEAMPEYGRLNNIRQFSLSLNVFAANASDLRKLLELGKNPDHYLELWNIRNRPDLDKYQIEIVRQLHNFVAAAKSLVDHSRRFYQQVYKTTGQFTQYESEIKMRFAENPLAQFVNCLRKYCQHYEMPPVGSELSWHYSKGAFHIIFLEKSSLNRFDGWNSAAEAFLEKASEHIDLYAIVTQYEKLVYDFYDWVDGQLRQIHGNDLSAVDSKKNELLKALGPTFLDVLKASLQIFETGIGRPDDIFLGIMDPSVFRRIESSFTVPLERARAFINQVNQLVQIPIDIEERIIKVFKGWYKDSRQ